jgi:hypothetical protein
MKKLLMLFVLILFALSADPGLLTVVFGQEHVWLHIQGKYIRKSTSSTDPNGIWMGCGVADREEGFGTPVNDAMAQWIKNNHGNFIRLSVDSFQGPTWFANRTMQQYWDGYLGAVFALYSSRQIYVCLDEHYYMHDGPWVGADGWSMGPHWNVDNPSWGCQRWLDDWVFMANQLKNNPWVAGYELCNEPIFKQLTPTPRWSNQEWAKAQCRRNFTECIKRIRQVDKRHIVFVGNHYWSTPDYISECWEDPTALSEDERMNPDPDARQACFSFHYSGMNWYASHMSGGLYVDPLWSSIGDIKRIQDVYQVPLVQTEFGDSGGARAEGSLGQQEMIEVLYGKRNFWNGVVFPSGYTDNYVSEGTPSVSFIPWLVWECYGSDATAWETRCPWSEIWGYAASIQASPQPVAGTTPSATQIICAASPKTIFANGAQTTNVRAIVCDQYGVKIYGRTDAIGLSMTGSGTWGDGTKTNKTVNAVDGEAVIQVKSALPGEITISAISGSLAAGTVKVTAVSNPVRVKLVASPDGLAANGTSTSLITATIVDESDHIVQDVYTGNVSFTVKGPGTIWLDANTQGNERILIEPGKTYVLLKAGATAGTAKITGSYSGLQSGTVNVYVGKAVPGGASPFRNLQIYPNPAVWQGTGGRMTFTNVPDGSMLKLYTLSGRFVKSVIDSDGVINWNCDNSAGNPVSPGVYLYVILDGKGGKSTGKVAITE